MRNAHKTWLQNHRVAQVRGVEPIHLYAHDGELALVSRYASMLLELKMLWSSPTTHWESKAAHYRLSKLLHMSIGRRARDEISQGVLVWPHPIAFLEDARW
jgi:hypothetical protein